MTTVDAKTRAWTNVIRRTQARRRPVDPDDHPARVRSRELKRIWTDSSLRRQGLARRVLVELEAEARRRGYTRVFLGTGPRQPEATALYPEAPDLPEAAD
jgi:GNAT superfamily N-acetyltransferase